MPELSQEGQKVISIDHYLESYPCKISTLSDGKTRRQPIMRKRYSAIDPTDYEFAL